MCTVSLVMDHYREKWEPLTPTIAAPVTTTTTGHTFFVAPISAEEIQEFRRLLERAREYDRRTGQPDCELEEKRQALKNVAKKLGVDIDFI